MILCTCTKKHFFFFFFFCNINLLNISMILLIKLLYNRKLESLHFQKSASYRTILLKLIIMFRIDLLYL